MANENNEKVDNKKETGSEENTSNPDTINNEYWGYDLYPERRGNQKRSWLGYVFGMELNARKARRACEKNVYHCIQNSPVVKLMMGALKSSGCEIDIRRHISCEQCYTTEGGVVTGGYDPELNQIIICQNAATSKGYVQGVMTHEMIHMFDYCRNKLDFKNLDHLACTEIRAANLAHCSFLSAWYIGTASPLNIKEAHQDCVKKKAAQSVMAVRPVSEEVAMEAINRVFTKCYNDLEPIGRRIRRNSPDMEKAYMDGMLYGYQL